MHDRLFVKAPESLTKLIPEETSQLERSWLKLVAPANALYCEQHSRSSAVVLFQIIRVQEILWWYCEQQKNGNVRLMFDRLIVVWVIMTMIAAIIRSQHTTPKKTRSCWISCPLTTYEIGHWGHIPVGNVLVKRRSVSEDITLWSIW